MSTPNYRFELIHISLYNPSLIYPKPLLALPALHMQYKMQHSSSTVSTRTSRSAAHPIVRPPTDSHSGSDVFSARRERRLSQDSSPSEYSQSSAPSSCSTNTVRPSGKDSQSSASITGSYSANKALKVAGTSTGSSSASSRPQSASGSVNSKVPKEPKPRIPPQPLDLSLTRPDSASRKSTSSTGWVSLGPAISTISLSESTLSDPDYGLRGPERIDPRNLNIKTISPPLSPTESLFSEVSDYYHQVVEPSAANTVKTGSTLLLPKKRKPDKRPVSLIASLRQVSRVRSSINSIRLPAGKMSLTYQELLQAIEQGLSDEAARCGEALLAFINGTIASVESGFTTASRNDSVFISARQRLKGGCAAFAATSDLMLDEHGRNTRMASSSFLWSAFNMYLSVSSDLEMNLLNETLKQSGELSVYGSMTVCSEEPSKSELRDIAGLSRKTLSLLSSEPDYNRTSAPLINVLRRIARAAADPARARRGRSDSVVPPVEIISTVEDAFTAPGSNRVSEQPTFNMCAPWIRSSDVPAQRDSSTVVGSSRGLQTVPVRCESPEQHTGTLSDSHVETAEQTSELSSRTTSSVPRSGQSLSSVDPNSQARTSGSSTATSEHSSRGNDRRSRRSSVSTVKSGSRHTTFKIVDAPALPTPNAPSVSSSHHSAKEEKTSLNERKSSSNEGKVPERKTPSKSGSSSTVRSQRRRRTQYTPASPPASPSSSSDSVPSSYEFRFDSSLSDSDSGPERESRPSSKKSKTPIRAKSQFITGGKKHDLASKKSFSSLNTLPGDGTFSALVNSLELDIRQTLLLFSDDGDFYQRELLDGTPFLGSTIGYDLQLDTNGGVFAASITALIRLLAQPAGVLENCKADILDTFLIFFRSITTPAYFFKLLVEQYNATRSAGLSKEETRAWNQKIILTKINIVVVLQTWLRHHWIEAQDGHLLDEIKTFAQDKVTKDSALPVQVSGVLANSLIEYAAGRRTKHAPRVEECIRRGQQNQPDYPPTAFEPRLASLQGVSEKRLAKISITFFLKDGGAEELARAITKLEWTYFHSFPPEEISLLRKKDHSQSIAIWEKFTASFYCWVSMAVMNGEDSAADRAKSYELFAKIAMLCKDMRNYNSSHTILSALLSPAVIRNEAMLDNVSQDHKNALNELQQFFYGSPNFRKYREELPQFLPAVPFLGVIKADVQALDQTIKRCIGCVIEEGPEKVPQCVFEVERYIHLRGLVRDLERCYAAYKFPQNDLVIRWIRLSCSRYDASRLQSANKVPVQ
ncbi:unnamed protein product [Somion occarium]|uniref:Ras GEF n=1 Tax=Somion occarium TaxID=3059160 RepID=A0ABP1DSB6_9APHY